MYTFRQLILVACLFSCLFGCKSDDDIECPNGEILVNGACEDIQEVITSVELIFNEVDTFAFRDYDGIGSQAPTVDLITLNANTAYNVQARVLDESKTPVEDKTTEIEEEGDHHQFFYTVINANVTVAYDDVDEDGNPIGLKTTMQTGDASTGSLQVTLKHLHDDKTGDPAAGETDIEVSFEVAIK